MSFRWKYTVIFTINLKVALCVIATVALFSLPFVTNRIERQSKVETVDAKVDRPTEAKRREPIKIWTVLPHRGRHNRWEVVYSIYSNQPNPHGLSIIHSVTKKSGQTAKTWHMNWDGCSGYGDLHTLADFVIIDNKHTNLSADVVVRSNGGIIAEYGAYQADYSDDKTHGASGISMKWRDREMVQAYRTAETIVMGHRKYVKSADYEEEYKDLVPIIYVLNAAERMRKLK